MILKIRYAASITLCFAHVTGFAMQQYSPQLDNQMRQQAELLMYKIRSSIKDGINKGALTTPQEIHGTMKQGLVDYVKQVGMTEYAMQVCVRARGLLVSEYNPALTKPIEIKNPGAEALSVDTVDGEPRALYVAQGKEGTALIWKKHNENWLITDRIEVKDKPFVRYVRAIKPRTTGIPDRSERVAIEFQDKSDRSSFGLSVYAKPLDANGLSSAQVWRKEGANIESTELIISYAFNEGGQHCALLTRKKDLSGNRLTFYERRHNHYEQIGSQLIDRGIEQLAWKGDTLIIDKKDVYNKIDLSFGRLLPMRPVTDWEQIKNMALEKLLGVRYWRADHHSKICIDDPLPMIAHYLAGVSAQKRAQAQKSQPSSLTNSPVSSVLSVAQNPVSSALSIASRVEKSESSLSWVPVYESSLWNEFEKSARESDTVQPGYEALYESLIQVKDRVPETIKLLEQKSATE